MEIRLIAQMRGSESQLIESDVLRRVGAREYDKECYGGGGVLGREGTSRVRGTSFVLMNRTVLAGANDAGKLQVRKS